MLLLFNLEVHSRVFLDIHLVSDIGRDFTFAEFDSTTVCLVFWLDVVVRIKGYYSFSGAYLFLLNLQF